MTIAIILACVGGPNGIVRAGEPTFNRDIRPILADRCFSCHGQDANKRRADLRLDQPDAATAPLPKHPTLRAFAPGNPGESEAIRRILSNDPDEMMPPPKSHLKLDAREKDLIQHWVKAGATWQQHWAFIKPTRPDAPAVQDAAWSHNDIDRFILARLERENLRPQPQAEKATLIRRVALDLTGLPPTPQEVDAFLADSSADAYEKVVDRYLASPHSGEHMAVQWLDGARYADSHGYQSDPERHMWPWRDWVINAYNKNMPFDQFAVEQLAGDLLPNATPSQIVATGFNRNHRINGEGGIIAEEWRIETVIDRVETTSAVFLGLTMGCCRCHDHKFDPITQKEFYSFCAYFNNVDENGGNRDREDIDAGINARPILRVATAEQQRRLDDLAAKITADEAHLKDLQSHTAELQQKWEADRAAFPKPGRPLVQFKLDGDTHGLDASDKPVSATFIGKPAPAYVAGKFAKAMKFDGTGGSVDAGQAVSFERTQAFSYGAWVYLNGDGGSILGKMDTGPSYRGFDLYLVGDRVMPHLVHSFPGNCIRVQSKEPLPKKSWQHVMVTYDGSSTAAGLRLYFNGQLQETDVLDDTLSDTILCKAPLLIGSRVGSSFMNGMVQDAEFYSGAMPAAEVAALAGADLEEILALAPEKRTADQKKRLTGIFESTLPEIAAARSEIGKARKEQAAIEKQVPNTMVMRDLPTPRDCYVLIRGQYDKHGDKVVPGVPSVLPALPKDAPPNRLALARWIVDPANPLTARVQANRLWEKFFGIGLVKTSENFGTQAEYPSNPELLDWLATELIARKWDLKAFQRLIVTSAAYQQSSNVTPELIERDPENRLLARGPRFRLSAEQVRDQALAVSGLLVDKLGGPSVKPYEPADLWSGNVYGNLGQYIQDTHDGLYRRSLYTFLKRTAAPANLTVFDMPSREYCIVKRSRTNTPLQALDLLNDPQYVEAARALAQRMMTDGGSAPADRIAHGFRWATCRPPTEHEAQTLCRGLERLMQKYHDDPTSAKLLVGIGNSPRDPKLDPAELAAYTLTASVILNLDEMVTKQ